MKLPKLETLIIFVFLLCVALWAVTKCGAKRSDLTRRVRETDEESDERPLRRDTVFVPQTPPATVAPLPQSTPTTTPVTPGQAPNTQLPTTVAPKPGVKPALSNETTVKPAADAQYPVLYVTIDGLKMRKTPGLKGDLVAKLELYEPVYFLNKKSEKPQEISLGYEKVTDYWVKVRTKSGKEGWVFGAGVHYYKMKRKGVLE